jgi:hypothetical protein
MPTNDLEATIEFLQRKQRVSIQTVIARLELNRGYFNSWRRSTKPERREDLEKMIKKAFPEYFTEEGVEKVRESSEYVKLLERTIEELRGERDILREQVMRLIGLIERTK